MNQKKCPQCKNLISVKSPTCLYCGRPNKFITNYYVKKKWDKEYKKDNSNNFKNLINKKKLLVSIFILIVVLICIYK